MFIDVFPTGPIQANCILIGDTQAGKLAVIDPGADAPLIHERIEKSGLQPSMILHTHGHIDHAGGTTDLCRLLDGDLPVGLHRDESEIYFRLETQAAMFGLIAENPPEPTLWLEHKMPVSLGNLSLEVRHTPGHSPGGVCFVVSGAPEPLVIVGDVLFAGSIGRTDLWGGSFPVLEKSIREQLYTLTDDTRVICGHGPDTTIGREKTSNPFVQA